MSHEPAAGRYDHASFYRRCGRSGLKLPALSLGLWHNFGAEDDAANSRELILHAFDLGITHFDAGEQLRSSARLGRGHLGAGAAGGPGRPSG